MQGLKMANEEFLLSLLKRARKGDEDAFKKLVEETRDKIFGAVAGMTGREAIANEILQEGYIALWDENISGDVEKPSKWLYKFCINKSIDYLRKSEPLLLDNFEDEVGFVSSPLPSPEIIVEEKETREKLIEVLSKMPKKERIVVLMSDYLGMDSFEIASILGSSPSTVRTQISNGRKKLAEFLKEITK